MGSSTLSDQSGHTLKSRLAAHINAIYILTKRFAGQVERPRSDCYLPYIQEWPPGTAGAE